MKKLNKIIFTVLVFSVMMLPLLSFAQGNGTNSPVGTTEIVNPITSTSLEALIKTILIGVIKIGIPIIALAIIYCGFLFVAARGNSEKIGKAKEALMYTLIGAAILLGSWAIALLIKDTVLAL